MTGLIIPNGRDIAIRNNKEPRKHYVAVTKAAESQLEMITDTDYDFTPGKTRLYRLAQLLKAQPAARLSATEVNGMIDGHWLDFDIQSEIIRRKSANTSTPRVSSHI